MPLRLRRQTKVYVDGWVLIAGRLEHFFNTHTIKLTNDDAIEWMLNYYDPFIRAEKVKKL